MVHLLHSGLSVTRVDVRTCVLYESWLEATHISFLSFLTSSKMPVGTQWSDGPREGSYLFSLLAYGVMLSVPLFATTSLFHLSPSCTT